MKKGASLVSKSTQTLHMAVPYHNSHTDVLNTSYPAQPVMEKSISKAMLLHNFSTIAAANSHVNTSHILTPMRLSHVTSSSARQPHRSKHINKSSGRGKKLIPHFCIAQPWVLSKLHKLVQTLTRIRSRWARAWTRAGAGAGLNCLHSALLRAFICGTPLPVRNNPGGKCLSSGIFSRAPGGSIGHNCGSNRKSPRGSDGIIISGDGILLCRWLHGKAAGGSVRRNCGSSIFLNSRAWAGGWRWRWGW